MTDRELMRKALENLEDVFGENREDVEIVKELRNRLAQLEQEPVAWANSNDLQNFDMRVRTNGGPLHTVPLYTTPPQRPWVGLTDEELESMAEQYVTDCYFDTLKYARAIEARLKEQK